MPRFWSGVGCIFGRLVWKMGSRLLRVVWNSPSMGLILLEFMCTFIWAWKLAVASLLSMLLMAKFQCLIFNGKA